MTWVDRFFANQAMFIIRRSTAGSVHSKLSMAGVPKGEGACSNLGFTTWQDRRHQPPPPPPPPAPWAATGNIATTADFPPSAQILEVGRAALASVWSTVRPAIGTLTLERRAIPT